EITLGEHANLSSGNVTTGNIIKGLRLVDDIDWTVWFESVSRIDGLLRARTDFEALDFPSRDAYRRAVEDLAKRSGREEYDVALQAVALAEEAQRSAGGDRNDIDVGGLLVGPRRVEFESLLGYAVPAGTRLYRRYRAAGWIGVVGPAAIL